ncbi:MAG: LysR family transcriptional regulator [Haliangiales bacterium]
MLDPVSVEVFVRVAQRLNISAAGRDLGLSAAVASRRLQQLEDALETRLFHRTTREVTLTGDGEQFLPYAEALLASHERALAAVGPAAERVRGVLRVSAPSSFGQLHMVPVIKDFLAQHRELELDLHLSDEVVDLAREGFDVVVRNAALTGSMSSLRARRLARDRRVVCAAPSYLERHGVPEQPGELAQHECVVLHDHSTWIVGGPDGPQSVRVRGRLRVSDGLSMLAAAEDGLGVVLISRWAASAALACGQLVPILTAFPVISEHAIWALYLDGVVSPKVRAFIDFFADRFGDPPYWEAAAEPP